MCDQLFVGRFGAGILVGRAREQGVVLTGESSLLGQLTKRVLESALEGELTDYLGYDKYERVESATNARNGSSTKTVLTDIGPVPIEVARDRDCSFQPQIVRKHQRRLSGVDEMVLSLSARGLTHGEISAHLAEVYGAEVSKTTITTITDRVVDGMTEWQNRPMDPGQFRSTPSGGRRRELRWPISRRGTDQRSEQRWALVPRQHWRSRPRRPRKRA